MKRAYCLPLNYKGKLVNNNHFDSSLKIYLSLCDPKEDNGCIDLNVQKNLDDYYKSYGLTNYMNTYYVIIII